MQSNSVFFFFLSTDVFWGPRLQFLPDQYELQLHAGFVDWLVKFRVMYHIWMRINWETIREDDQLRAYSDRLVEKDKHRAMCDLFVGSYFIRGAKNFAD